MQKVKLLQTRAERIIAIWRMRMMIRWWWWCIHVAIAIRRQGESEPAQRSDNGQRLPRRNIYVLHFMKRQAYLKNYFQNKIWNYNKRIYVKPGCVLSPRGPTGHEVRYLSSSPVSTNRLIWEGNPCWLMAWHWTSGLIDHDGWATWQNWQSYPYRKDTSSRLKLVAFAGRIGVWLQSVPGYQGLYL